jgi:deoxycytidylate deaminase
MMQAPEYYIPHVEQLKKFSDDLSRQNGAIIVDEKGMIIGQDTNRLPVPLDDRTVKAFQEQAFLDYFNAAYKLEGDLAIRKNMIQTPQQMLEFFNQRPYKYNVMGHAERGAIFNAARGGYSTMGATMIASWFPCVPCATAIIGSGIKRLFVIEGPDYDNLRWGVDWKTAEKFLELARVETVILGR